ncbi:MAG TPA: sigma-70 family RNA polymerase sigma factor [Candidatus Angelobacter sp.]|nr:sigma-70 family RNA polymerase sigma factor [Candidatus Angelobacter sp.]
MPPPETCETFNTAYGNLIAGVTTSSQAASSDVPSNHTGMPQQSVFATTHWSVVLAAGNDAAPKAQDALEKLCRIYWHPLYAYARRRGHSPADAEDLAQGFFAWLLERKWLARADQERGRFRSFLLTSFSNFLANEWDKARAQKRGGGQIVSLQLEEVEVQYAWESAEHFTAEQSFELRWALALLDEVLRRLEAEFAKDGKTELFEALKPCLLGERSAQPYAALAAKLGMTEGSVKVAVHRLRQRYRQLLRDEIANTVSKPDEVEEEMRYLFAVLSRR